MPALITPFTRSGEVDTRAHTHNLRVLAEKGIEGFVIGGSNGEGPYLEPGERSSLVKTGRRRKAHFMVGIAAESTRVAVRQIQEAADAVADSVLVMTPTTLARGRDEAILRFAVDHDLPAYAGSEDDVLDRFYQAARRYGVAVVVRVTPDCPLLDPAVSGLVLARFLGYAVAGLPPEEMGLGPAYAVPKVLRQTGLRLEQVDLIELNEAFAAQVLGVMGMLDLDPAKVNVNGGAIALGHPLGASGSRILLTLLHELRRRQGRYGVGAACVGGGMGIAVIVEYLQ